MSLKQKEYLSIDLGLAGAVVGIIGSQLGTGWTPLTVAGLTVVIAALALRFAWHRCPHCGAYLGRHWAECCPRCGKRINYD